MDRLTFTIEIIKSVSWPLTALVIVLILRKPIIALPPLIKKLKIKDVEIEFDNISAWPAPLRLLLKTE